MKKHFKFGAIALTLLLASCGGEEAKKTETAAAPEKPKYDCECTEIEDWKKGGIKKAIRDGKDFTGTCVELSNNRAQDTLGIHSFEKGYRVKSLRWQMVLGERKQIKDISYDEDDKKTGYEKKYHVIDKKEKYWYTKEYKSYEANVVKDSWAIRPMYGHMSPWLSIGYKDSKYIKSYDEYNKCDDINWSTSTKSNLEKHKIFAECVKNQNVPGFEYGGF
jgi:hypothetical protein